MRLPKVWLGEFPPRRVASTISLAKLDNYDRHILKPTSALELLTSRTAGIRFQYAYAEASQQSSSRFFNDSMGLDTPEAGAGISLVQASFSFWHSSSAGAMEGYVGTPGCWRKILSRLRNILWQFGKTRGPSFQ